METSAGAASKAPLSSGIRRLALVIPCLAGVTLIGGIIAYCKTFSSISTWDDEGGLMLTAKHFLAGYPLYDEVYAHHGPFYYLVNWLIFGPTGLQVDHDHFGMITVLMWVTACCLGSLSVYRMTRDVILAVLVQVVLVSHLSALANEPGHPQGLVCVFSALGVLVSTFYTPARGSAVCLSLGAIAGALLLTKANVGGFVLIALALSFLLPGKARRGTLALRALAAVAALALPLVLTRAHWNSPGAPNYVLPACLSLVPIVLLGWGHEMPAAFRPKDYAAAALACALTGLLICGLVRWHGTSAYGILYGVVLQHSTFAGTFGSIPDQGRRALVWAAGGVGLSLLYLWARGHDGRLAGAVRSGLSWAKLAFGAAVIYYSYRFRGDYEALLAFLAFVTPLLWLGLIPGPGKAAPVNYFPRLVLVSLAALLTLQAYPVFGSQITIGTFLMDLVAALCLHDVLARAGALSALRRGAADGRFGVPHPDAPAAVSPAGGSLSPEPPRPGWAPFLRRPSSLRRLGGGLVVALVLALLGREARLSYRWHAAQMPLGLPGAGRVRLTEQEVATYNWLVSNLRASSDTFISAPELDSLYFWAGKEPPTRLNANCWMTFFTDGQQRAILDELAHYSRVCAVRNRPALRTYYEMDTRRRVDPDHDPRPLMHYIDTRLKAIGRVGDYEFLVPRERDDVGLVYCAQLSPAPGDDPPPPEAAHNGGHSHRKGETATTVATLALPALAGRTAHAIALYDLTRGVAIAEAALESDIDLGAPRRLEVPIRGRVTVDRRSFNVVRLLGPRGEVIASLPVLR
jgi:hypothetical protein